jgi:cysteinyl-tRNA synthetase
VLRVFGLPQAAAAPAVEVPEAVLEVAKARWAAKQARNFAEADRLRGEITALGWNMLDGKADYRLEKLRAGS